MGKTETDVISKKVKIQNLKGLHARATANFVKLADTFKCDIFVEKNGFEVSGKSIMGLLMLAAPLGETLVIKAKGEDAPQAVQALCALVKDKFGEEN
ncbi:MAG: HPr family phosphocarrier protein [Alphaproteobacteria bacterium]|nr:HPr family phosphocarrier protein [Alphaproteobacteria bacterium]